MSQSPRQSSGGGAGGAGALKRERSKKKLVANNGTELTRRPSFSPVPGGGGGIHFVRRRGAVSPQLLTQQLLYASETSLPGPAVVHAENVSSFCGVRNRYDRYNIPSYL
jgi:hypothetical protein